MAGDGLWLLSWNLRNGLVPPDRSLRDTLRQPWVPAACTDKEHLITGMLPDEGGFAIMLQRTGIAIRAQEMHVAAALRDKGYTPFFSSWLAETGATSSSRGGGLLTAVSSKYVAEHEVLSFTEIVPGKAAALEIRTDGGGLTLINVHGPQAGCSACTQPRWETPGGHHRRHHHLHGCHHQPGHRALPSGLGGLRFLEGHGRWRGGHDPHAPPVPAQGGHLPGQRAPHAVVPAGKRLGSRHARPPGNQLGPPAGPPGTAGPPQRSGARGGAHPLQPHGAPPPPVRRRGRARPTLPAGGGHRRAG